LVIYLSEHCLHNKMDWVQFPEPAGSLSIQKEQILRINKYSCKLGTAQNTRQDIQNCIMYNQIPALKGPSITRN